MRGGVLAFASVDTKIGDYTAEFAQTPTWSRGPYTAAKLAFVDSAPQKGVLSLCAESCTHYTCYILASGVCSCVLSIFEN